MRFVATLEPRGPTKTAVELAVRPGPKFEKRVDEHPQIRDFYLAAMREQVESKLEDREYDMTRTYGAMGRAIAANMGQIARDAEAAGEAARKREKDNIRKAYEREAAGE